ncbi:N-acetylmuramoyl-L-alanine amidase [Leptothoe sp. LEGE 181152]|nr:N-acetylmuramoyl-L-alanine amidase [Leptothoe sp. LEGE 181152]
MAVGSSLLEGTEAVHWNPLLSSKAVASRMSSLTSGVIGILGAVLIALPADAANLQFWRFDQQQNRLTFTTDTRVQPTAKLIFNPTRLVIDLPGTQVTSATSRQRLQEGLREVRVGQLDDQTARIVIEVAPGYSLDPQQVEVRGETNRRWFVQLPELVATDDEDRPRRSSSSARVNQSSDQAERASGRTTNQVTADANASAQSQSTQVQSIVATADGFFIRLSGDTPEVRLSRSRRRDPERKITLELPNSSVSPRLTPASLPDNRYSIENWEISQSDSTVFITMTLGDDSPDWQTITTEIGSSLRGISVLPDGVAIRDIPDSAPSSTVPVPSTAVTRRPSERPSSPSDRARVNPTEPSSASSDLPRVPQGRIVVAIDPGHGGRDPGAVGIGGLQEKQVIFPISQQVAAILREQGVDVVMTRNSDIELDLDPRVQIAERADADLFVSIHANAINLSRPDVNGLETYYYSGAGARFARTVHDVVLRMMGMSDRRVRQARFYVLRRTSMPAILIEVGFVTGAEDIHNLRDPEWRSEMANAIARGILTHIQREF